ncbi:hypothetical protein VTL71DRAFT_14562 [Oculimacula yallundae]|uniref:Uncharacterized protein n=1 Tax=Oculimacula yallundae TaxID=86028 RepID=A0ABR4CIZ8_9HELO
MTDTVDTCFFYTHRINSYKHQHKPTHITNSTHRLIYTTAKMPSLLDNLGSLISSIVSGITAIIGSILAVFQSIFNTILGVIGTAFSAVGTMVSGLAQTFEGLLKFLLSNIFVIGAVVGALFLYGVYQQRSGKAVTQRPAGAKKIN